MKILKSKCEMYEVHIMNLRREQPQIDIDFKVDRSSVLGNPFLNGTREINCDRYERAFKMLVFNVQKMPEVYEHQTVVKSNLWFSELDRIYGALLINHTVRLFCWCVPLRCHSETIAKYLIDKIDNG
jgi:hypothetical protein